MEAKEAKVTPCSLSLFTQASPQEKVNFKSKPKHKEMCKCHGYGNCWCSLTDFFFLTLLHRILLLSVCLALLVNNICQPYAFLDQRQQSSKVRPCACSGSCFLGSSRLRPCPAHSRHCAGLVPNDSCHLATGGLQRSGFLTLS